jgi:hypothetical protein
LSRLVHDRRCWECNTFDQGLCDTVIDDAAISASGSDVTKSTRCRPQRVVSPQYNALQRAAAHGSAVDSNAGWPVPNDLSV